eukprot:4499769-Pyramimonas_sp.AAC.1
MQVLLKGAHIAILGGCLYNGVGIAGASVEELHHMASFVPSLSTPWVILCDWNFPPGAFWKAGWLNLVQGGILVADSVDYACTGGQGTLLDCVVAPGSVLEYLDRARADTELVGEDGKAHSGIALDLLPEAKEAEGRALGLPKAVGPPNQQKKMADPNSERSRKLAAVPTPTAS